EQSVIGLWHDLGSVTTPALLLPVGTALLERGRLPARWTLTAMTVAFAISLYGVAARALTPKGAPALPLASIEPIYLGLAVSFACYAAGWIAAARGRRKPEPF